MDFDVGQYVTQNYRHFATKAERDEYGRVFDALKKCGGADDPNLPRAVERWKEFHVRTGGRILRDHADEIFLNRCPKCGSIAATPRARQCGRCFYQWHHLAERGQPPRDVGGP